jgi:hypothetical protein
VKSKHFRGRRFTVVSALLGVTAVAAVLGISASAGAAATSQPTKLAGQMSTTLLTKISQTNKVPTGLAPTEAFVACSGQTPLLPEGPCPLAPPADDDGGAAAAPAFVPHASGAMVGPKANGPTLGANFLGITDVSQRVDTGYHYTPPDQALCVGPAGPLNASLASPLGVPDNQTIIVEGTNDGWAAFDTSGNMLWHDSAANVFTDPNSSGDPECTYDTATGSYFFTEIGVPNNSFTVTYSACVSEP